MQGTVTVSDNLSATIDARIAELDQLISTQLSEVMHAPAFQKLESSWTGLQYLCKQTSTGEQMKIKVFNASKKELVKDFKTAIDFDQSALFKKVYEEEFGTFGGAPFATMIGDYEIGRGAEDMYFVEQMSHVAAAAHAPFISAASAEIMGLESYTDLGKPRDLAKVFDTVEYAKWKSFRESEDSRYVGLTLPHVLMRLPYGPETVPVEAFNFKEDVDGTDHSKYLWGNAAYAMGARLTDAFAKYGWTAAIRGVEGGGGGATGGGCWITRTAPASTTPIVNYSCPSGYSESTGMSVTSRAGGSAGAVSSAVSRPMPPIMRSWLAPRKS